MMAWTLIYTTINRWRPRIRRNVVSQDDGFIIFRRRMEWKHTGTPRLKNSEVLNSVGERVASFWGCKGAILVNCVLQGTIIAGTYCEILEW
jgi:hypothetical protein